MPYGILGWVEQRLTLPEFPVALAGVIQRKHNARRILVRMLPVEFFRYFESDYLRDIYLR